MAPELRAVSTIESIDALEALYPDAVPAALDKVHDALTPLYRDWLAQARFCVLATVGPEGSDTSPRGDLGPVVDVVDDRTLLLPDWRGNNRLDSLRNIVRDGRVSLMFMVHGSDNVVRVNGRAHLSVAADTCARFDREGKQPRSVIVVAIEEVYYQCAKALMRSQLWTPRETALALPTAGAFNKEVHEAFDAQAYDAGYADYARPRMW